MPKQKNIKQTIALALSEILKRLTPEEKKEFVKILDWNELEGLREEVKREKGGRKSGDPKLYVGTTLDGLDLELPLVHVVDFVQVLPKILGAERVEIFLEDDTESQELFYPVRKLKIFFSNYSQYLLDGFVMMEFESATLITTGGGCMLLTLEGKISTDLIKKIAEEVLKICGFKYEFTKDRFTAIVWDDELVVNEKGYKKHC